MASAGCTRARGRRRTAPARARATVEFRPGGTGAERGLAGGGASEGEPRDRGTVPRNVRHPEFPTDTGEFRQRSSHVRGRVCIPRERDAT